MRRGSSRQVMKPLTRTTHHGLGMLAILAAVLFVVLSVPSDAFAANPHGGYTSSSGSCQLCHDLHVAEGDSILTAQSQKLLCYNCHDGTGSALNTKAEFGESVVGTTTAKSSHPVPTGVMQCADCHTPHAGPAEGNPGSLSAGSSEATGGVAVCGACHGSGSALPGGNLAEPIAGTPHASITSSASVAGIACVACHEPHASSNADLVRSTLRTESQTTITVSGEPGLCLGCHQDSGGMYAGASAAGTQKHSTVASSTKALTSWPGASGSAAGCDGCHEPHGRGSGPSYTRVSGEDLCRTCHDDASLVYPAGYSYRGASAFSGSGHEGITAPGISYTSVLAEPPGFAAWESTVVPTPSSPGTPVTPARAAALLTSDGSRLVTSLQLVDGDWDYQMYRFKAPIARGDMTAIRVHWEGYGEEAAGFPVVLSAWNVGSGAWDLLQSAQMITQATVNLPLSAANHVADDGYIYLMAKARYSRDEALVSGPTITAINGNSAQVEWVTSGLTSSWVDCGTTSSYTKTTGTAVRTQTHSVRVTGLAPGVWHFRVRSVALDGSSYTSGDIVRGIPRPTIAPNPTGPGWAGADVLRTFTWAAPLSAPGGPFEFRFFLYKDGALYSSTDWTTATTRDETLGLGVYTWRVEARDASGNSYDYSIWGTHYIYDATGSCPFLFTWDGGKFDYEADLYTTGKLASPRSNGTYQKPNPNDYYVLDNTPVEKDGALELRLVEERFETDYLDAFQLFAVDVPEGRTVVAEKIPQGGTYQPLEDVIHTVSSTMSAPLSATRVKTGEDVLSRIAETDGVYAVLSPDVEQPAYESIELDLGDLSDAEAVKLVFEGMSRFPETPEGKVLGTAGVRQKVEVVDASGNWVALPGDWPKPAEFARPYMLDLTGKFPTNDYRVRLTFLLKTYVDSVKLDTTADEPLKVTEVERTSAELRRHGVDGKSSDGDIYEYVYGEPNSQSGYLPGNYTRFGEVGPLLSEADDKHVIYGCGDEIAMRYKRPAPAQDGMTHTYVVYAKGYYKDLNTDVEKTVEPLPFSAMSNYPYPASERYPDDADHVAYQTEWNTRVHGAAAIEASDAAGQGLIGSAVSWVKTTVIRTWDKVVALVTPTAGDDAIEAAAEEPLHRSLNTDVVALEVTGVGTASDNACAACHAPHGGADSGKLLAGGRGAADGRTCTADGTGACHDNAANSASGIDIRAAFTSGSDLRTRHDVMPADQRASGGKTACGDCHNPHSNNAEVRFSDPDDPSKTIASPLGAVLDGTGMVSILVGGKHDAVGPTISNIVVTALPSTQESPTVSWTTNEKATSWIDWGLTDSYELGNESLPTPFGNSSLVTAHSVQMSGLAFGTTYHYRIRTTDALGNTTYSADRTFKPTTPPPIPVMSDVTTQTGPDGWGPIPVEVSCTTVLSDDGHPIRYEFQLNGASIYGSDTPSYVFSLSDGTYSVRVRARDSVDTAAVSDWSAPDTFVVNNADPSCPTLYTWDGTKYRFVTDVMGLGSVGVKKGPSTYLVPEPVEDSVIPQGALVPRDGKLDLRLTDEKAEVEFVDEVSLRAVDHPVGTRLLTNDLHWGATSGGREPTEYFTIADPQPVSATYERIPVLGTQTVPETDVSAKLAVEGDGEVAYSGLYDDNIWTFDLGKLGDPAQIKLVLSGWVDYANRAEKTAWLQSGKRPPASYMEVQDASGQWIAVGDAPHPPGYPKTVVYDLTDVFPDGITDYKVRMRIYMRMNVDYVGVDTTPDAAVKITELQPLSADLSYKGLSLYSETPYPAFTYADISPVEPRLQTGAFTRYGDVRQLLTAADDMFVVMNTGDDLALTFDEPLAPEPGMARSYMLHTDGYHQTISGSVDPMPFHAMSNYPYSSDEHYPDDPEHVAYLAEWNTRVVAPVAEPAPVAAPVTFKEMHPAAMVVDPAGSYALVSDQMLLMVTRKDGTTVTRTPASGWESASSEAAKPTPGAPGLAVGAGELAAVVADDSSGWGTSEAVVDGDWNWQLAQFDLSDIPLGDIESVNIMWRGHGGPTAGYDVAVYTWNPLSAGWTTITKRLMVQDTTVATSAHSLDQAFCLRCHDGIAPAGVVVPAGLANIGARWNALDYHGAGSGAGSTGLKPPYAYGQGSIACATCHDTHGTSNPYHIPSVVNGQVVPPIVTGSDLGGLCRTCHEGSASVWHPESRCGCHYNWGPGDDHQPSFEPHDAMDCSVCHNGHTTEMIHLSDCAGCH